MSVKTPAKGPRGRFDFRRSPILSALVAAGGSLAALPANALELGDVNVESTLGQPLRASIAYALAPNEMLAGNCVSLQPFAGGDGMPSVNRASIAVSDGLISVTSSSIVHEPLMAMRLNIRCPYAPQLTRDYMLFFDPALPATAQAATAAPQTLTTAVPQTRAATAGRTPPAPVARSSQNRTAAPVPAAGRYRVQPGDSLSLIAQRVEGRQQGLWDTAGAIFDANPDAFINDDPNRLKAGAWLVIPDVLTAAMPGADADVFAPGSATVEATVVSAPAAEAVVATTAPAATAAPVQTIEAAPETAPETEATAAVDVPPAATARDRLSELRPGDVVPVDDNPFVTPAAETTVIPDTAIAPPVAPASRPSAQVTAARPAVEDESGSSSGLLWWLLGGGLAVVGALLFLGNAIRARFGSSPIAPVAMPQRRMTDINPQAAETAPDTDLDFDLDIEDGSPTHENLVLDADLVAGTGLEEGTDVELGQDFGFARTTALDIELPEDMSSGFYEAPSTDIIPPLNMDVESILESEVLPDEDDEYDMSVIVDATKMPQPEDVTERDLEAIELLTAEQPALDDDYTLNDDVDFTILEQDYEDELTATQALNQEIARAAAELAEHLEADSEDDGTAEMSKASVTALDITAQLPVDRDDATISETGLTAELQHATDADDKTAEMPAADNDATEILPFRKRGTK